MISAASLVPLLLGPLMTQYPAIVRTTDLFTHDLYGSRGRESNPYPLSLLLRVFHADVFTNEDPLILLQR
jgi:hypothetical protein